MASIKSNNTYLEVEGSSDTEEDFQKLIEQAAKLDEESQLVKPEIGFCVKTKDDSKNKVFLNICHCPEMPSPDTLSEEDLQKILNSDDPSTYRIPVSLGEPHQEADKGGQTCLAYDVIVSTTFYARIENSELFKIFLVTVGIQGLEDKYNINLGKDDWVILKNKRYHGTMPKHFIRKPPKVSEISGPWGNMTSPAGPSTVTGSFTQGPPDWVLLRPRSGTVLEARFLLDKMSVEDFKDPVVELKLNEERLFLSAPPHYTTVDVDLPLKIQTDKCNAVYRKHSKVLQLKMPICEERLVMLQ